MTPAALRILEAAGLIKRVRDLACACARRYLGEEPAASQPFPEKVVVA